MHRVDTAAWTDTLGVGSKEMPWVLQGKVRQLFELYEDVNRLRSTLAQAPDEELILMLTSACRSLAAAGERLAQTLNDTRTA
jgi:hypothetical protein